VSYQSSDLLSFAGRKQNSGYDVLSLGMTAAMKSGDRIPRGGQRAYVTVSSDSMLRGRIRVLDDAPSTRIESDLLFGTFGLLCVLSAEIASTSVINKKELTDVRDEVMLILNDGQRFETEIIVGAECLLAEGYDRIIADGGDDVVALNIDRVTGDLPDEIVVVPGSFNPFHRGHELLAKAALASRELPLYYELAVNNADKPQLERDDVMNRMDPILLNGSNVILTAKAFFHDKAKLYKEAGAHKIDFVVGFDTFVRILNVKYYNNDESEMVQSLTKMLNDNNVHFIVGGRADEDGSFFGGEVAGKKIIDGRLPSAMFKFLEESEFRTDISSTEIRKSSDT